tara:strand:- start:121 stop:801 length:681 start_codon:yes stop_codon:yes gene_type:complete
MLEIEYINLDDIIEADENPKDHDLGVLYESMKRFGFTDPIMLNEASGKLLAGHGRLQALKLFKDRGEKAPDRIQVEPDIEDDTIEDWFIPVIKGINIENSADAQAYLIADNRITEIGGWKPMELIESLNEVIEETGNLDGTGYDLDDIETILRDIERDSFSVDGEDTTISPESLDDETEVTIAVGRYKFKVPAEDFYDWEEMVKSSSGAQDVVGISLWIKENLGLN